MKNDDFDFGFSFSDDLEEAVNEHAEAAKVAQDKAQKLYDMIMPLLNNLKKNPDKPNIVWPDRDKKIDEFISKMNKVLSS
jgi:hypothetical protein